MTPHLSDRIPQTTAPAPAPRKRPRATPELVEGRVPVERHGKRTRSPRRPGVYDRVLAARPSLLGRPLNQIYAWARGQGLTGTRNFDRFKQALSDTGICDWDEVQARTARTRHLHLADRCTHVLRLHAAACDSSGRFALAGEGHRPLWFGRTFPDGAHAGQRPEVDVVFKAIWFAGKVRLAHDAPALRVELILMEESRAEIAPHIDRLRARARADQIDLQLTFFPIGANHAWPLVQSYRFKRWNEGPLMLATPRAGNA